MTKAATPSNPAIDRLRCVIWLLPACLGSALMDALTHWGMWALDLVVFAYPVTVVLLGRADAKLRLRQDLEEDGQDASKIWGHTWRFVAVQALIVTLVVAVLEWFPSLGVLRV